MDTEKFWLLLSAKLSGEATPEEIDALEEIIKQHPELSWQVQLMSQMWKHEPEANAPDDFFDRHLQRLSIHPDTRSPVSDEATFNPTTPYAHEEEQKKTGTYRWLLMLSGIAATLITVFFFFYKNESFTSTKEEAAAQNTVTTRKGSKSSIQLPDGTTVWLNADSKLTYDENFRGDFRKVHLQGEAYFDVVRDEHRPFIIHTKTLDIRVLGTVFNVKAYDAESNTETSLIKGSVEVTLHNSPEKKIILKPNEKLRVNNQSFEYSTDINGEKRKDEDDSDNMKIVVGKIHYQKKDSMALEALWVRNKLVFDAETLQEVMRKIERWYNVRAVINVDDKTKATQFSAIFDNENLAQVMEALKITGSFSYVINKDVVIIK
ncbi:MAG: FecR domain-containing protein [Chitinophagaceae bacterium]|nr:FecR domain-containing protein [Chitinophagaceae bacterium]